MAKQHPDLLITSFILCILLFVAAVFAHSHSASVLVAEDPIPVRVNSTEQTNDITFVSPSGMFSAAYAKVTPTKKHMVYVKNHGLLCDIERTVDVNNTTNQTVIPIVALTGNDPCAGISFDTRWSDNNEYVKVSDTAYKVGVYNPLFTVDKHVLYEL